MRRPALVLLAVPAAALAVAGCGSAGAAKTSTPSASFSAGGRSKGAGAPAKPGRVACRRVAAPPPKGAQHLKRPTLRLDPSKGYTATVVTNCGTFAFTLDVKRAPKTSASFDYLAKKGFYDGLIFHRVARGFVIQGGDPLGNGIGGPGYQVVEPPPPATRYVQGTVAMAKAGNDPAGASGSQFFVVTAAQDAGLPPQYAVVGQVVRGQAVVNAIGRLPTTPPGDGQPTRPVVIDRLTVTQP